MTYEAVPVEGPYEIHDFTVSPNTAVDKGTLMYLSGERLAAASTTNSQVWAGIAMSDKVATDNAQQLGCATKGIFSLYCGGSAVTLGSLVSLSGGNIIKPATEAEVITGDVIGKALETIEAGQAGEVFVGQL